MIINGMAEFESICKNKLVLWYNSDHNDTPNRETIDLSNVYVVWSCKTLQNYKLLASTTCCNDGIYAEYTFNGDKGELYEDIYRKILNTCHNE